MVELAVAVVELVVQVFLALLQFVALAVELIGGLIALAFERLDRAAARARAPSSEVSPPESNR